MKIRASAALVPGALALSVLGLVACGGGADLPIEETAATRAAALSLDDTPVTVVETTAGTTCQSYNGVVICGGLSQIGGGTLENLSCCIPPGSRATTASCPAGSKTGAGNCRCEGTRAQQDSCERANANQGFTCGGISQANQC